MILWTRERKFYLEPYVPLPRRYKGWLGLNWQEWPQCDSRHLIQTKAGRECNAVPKTKTRFPLFCSRSLCRLRQDAGELHRFVEKASMKSSSGAVRTAATDNEACLEKWEWKSPTCPDDANMPLQMSFKTMRLRHLKKSKTNHTEYGQIIKPNLTF